MADLHLSSNLIADLMLRSLWLEGTATLRSLQASLKLPFAALEEIFQQFRQQQLVEVKQASGRDYTFALTATGRSQALTRMETCQYAGPAPVSLHEYERIVRAQAAVLDLNRDQLRSAFHDLVLTDALLDRLGLRSSPTGRCFCTEIPAAARPASPSASFAFMRIRLSCLTRSK